MNLFASMIFTVFNLFTLIPMSDWISVNLERPKPYTFVLATVVSKYESWVEIVGFNGNEFQLPGRDKPGGIVVYWMPLPEPETLTQSQRDYLFSVDN